METKLVGALALGGLLLSACAPEETPEESVIIDEPEAEDTRFIEDEDSTSGVVPIYFEYNEQAVLEAIAHPDRPAADVARDEQRKPLETLEFVHIAPGMTILELEAGGGYFTELFARTVGPEGRVYMQNPQAFDVFVADALEERLAGDRLPKVIQLRTNFDELTLEDESVDIVTWFQGPHELWVEPDGEKLGAPEASFAEIARVLRPGGVFVAIDHRAEEGTGTEMGSQLHRISEGIVTDYAEAAGLLLGQQGDFLANPEDPLTINVLDASIQGQTDQFALYFIKSY